MLRGSAAEHDWPKVKTVAPDTFIGRVRAKTGISGFDLPTQAQWEYACRAGTTTDRYDGSNLIKNGVGRVRPCYNDWMNANGLRLPYGIVGGKFGFFSAHAGNTFAFAMASYLGLKWYSTGNTAKIYGWCVFTWAAFVSVSRLVMGAHFLGDITVGAMVGMCFGAAWAWIARKVFRL